MRRFPVLAAALATVTFGTASAATAAQPAIRAPPSGP